MIFGNRFCVLILLLLTLAGESMVLKAQPTPFQEGMKWYKQREVQADSFRAESKYINEAIDAFEKAMQNGEHHREAGLHLLKSYYFKGMFLGLNTREEKEVFDKGRSLGEALGQKYPESVPIKFWYAANMGRWAKVHGFMASATSGVAKKLRNIGEEIVSLDKKYQDGGGYRILAQVYFYTPKIPILMGWPSDRKALEYMEKAMDIGPGHPTNRMLYAELLLHFNRQDQAREQLEKVIGMEPRPDYLIPDRYVIHRAGRLLKEHFPA